MQKCKSLKTLERLKIFKTTIPKQELASRKDIDLKFKEIS
jgi:hypothetical protein